MSPEPSVWPAQDDHHSRSLAAAQPPREARPRRSRRKKDDEGDLDRKDTKLTKPKEKEKDKDKDREKEKDKEKSREKDNNKENDKDKDGQEQKESKRGNRRQRDKSVSLPNAHSSTNSASHSRKKPKLEETPAEQRPSMPVSTAPPAPIPAPTAAPAPAAPTTPAASPPAPLPAASLYHHHHYHHHQPPSHLQQGPRPSLQSSASLPSSAHPTPVQSVSYHSHTMAPVGPPPRPQSQPPPPPPTRTSGQNFDPIRSAFDTATPAPAPVSTPGPSSTFSPSARPPSPRPPFRASASPAIASIIDPPTNSSPPLYAPRSYVSPGRGNSAYSPSPAATPAIAPTPPPLFPPQARPVSPYAHRSPYPPQPQPQPQQPSHQSPPSNPSPPAQHAPMIPPAIPEPSQPASSNNQRAPSPEPTSMDVDADRSPPSAVATTPKKENKAPPTAPPTAPPSDPTSPKPPRGAKEAPSALPQGSGLISNALFGMGDGASTDDPSSQRTPSIILHIPLQGNGDRIVNFARLAEEQYGFAALHPRLAAHKERLARVAAAGAALERNDKIGRGVSAGESADEDLSLEMDRDSDLEGESALGPSVARANGPEATEGKKKRRRKKMEEYDRDDPFVDDSELAWQEQAAASKDGFFVYSGPLVPEGEKVQVERADGTIKRGRGRGRGGRGRGPPTTQHQVPLAAAVPISQETGLPLRGPGSRGGNPRRPRAKAARQQTEQDKPNGNGHTSHGRGGGVAGRGGSTSTRGGKTPSMVELAPRPNIATPPSGPGHELATK